jgi:hypothetical protein
MVQRTNILLLALVVESAMHHHHPTPRLHRPPCTLASKSPQGAQHAAASIEEPEASHPRVCGLLFSYICLQTPRSCYSSRNSHSLGHEKHSLQSTSSENPHHRYENHRIQADSHSRKTRERIARRIRGAYPPMPRLSGWQTSNSSLGGDEDWSPPACLAQSASLHARGSCISWASDVSKCRIQCCPQGHEPSLKILSKIPTLKLVEWSRSFSGESGAILDKVQVALHHEKGVNDCVKIASEGNVEAWRSVFSILNSGRTTLRTMPPCMRRTNAGLLQAQKLDAPEESASFPFSGNKSLPMLNASFFVGSPGSFARMRSLIGTAAVGINMRRGMKSPLGTAVLVLNVRG